MMKLLLIILIVTTTVLTANAQSNSSPAGLRRLADEYYNWRN